ncbi:MAG: hypothetical protein ABWW65_04260 [Thermoprotei archaeon]
MNIYDKVMDSLSSILFKNSNGVNVLKLEWDHLIVLDACRCDIFRNVYRFFFSEKANFECITSTASSTMEFVRKNMKDPEVLRKLKDVVFVNANPVIDHVLGDVIHKVFYKYIPVWKKYWNGDLGTVEPKYTYMTALKAFLRHPDKRMMVWFLQPHYPYIDKRFHHINALGRKFMNRARQNTQDSNLVTLARIIMTLIRKGYLCAGIPDRVCEYIHQTSLEAIKAYTSNLLAVLQYVKKLTGILPGKIIVTSDHGEAFGEPLNKILPLHVYGHPSRIRTPSLTQVPCLSTKNDISRHIAARRALKEVISSNALLAKGGHQQ